jgi:hypothetical protein
MECESFGKTLAKTFGIDLLDQSFLADQSRKKVPWGCPQDECFVVG